MGAKISYLGMYHHSGRRKHPETFLEDVGSKIDHYRNILCVDNPVLRKKVIENIISNPKESEYVAELLIGEDSKTNIAASTVLREVAHVLNISNIFQALRYGLFHGEGIVRNNILEIMIVGIKKGIYVSGLESEIPGLLVNENENIRVNSSILLRDAVFGGLEIKDEKTLHGIASAFRKSHDPKVKTNVLILFNKLISMGQHVPYLTPYVIGAMFDDEGSIANIAARTLFLVSKSGGKSAKEYVSGMNVWRIFGAHEDWKRNWGDRVKDFEQVLFTDYDHSVDLFFDVNGRKRPWIRKN